MQDGTSTNVSDAASLPAASLPAASLPAAQPDAAHTAGQPQPVSTFPRSRFHESVTWCAQRLAVSLDALAGPRGGGGFGILTYHRVASNVPGVESPTVNVTPEQLRSQLSGLLARGFRAWSLSDALAACAHGEPVPDKAFVVTFDDGYGNNLLEALPILKELQVPATVFLATAYLDSHHPFPFDNWSGIGSAAINATSWRPLTTDQCRELMAWEGIELGAHTHTHQLFSHRPDDFRQDMATCLETLRDRLNITSPTFSFPFGIFTPEMQQIARECGVRCALTTRQQRVRAQEDPFEWGRFNATAHDTVATLTAKLNGWFTPVADLLRAVKRPLAALVPRLTGEMCPHSQPYSPAAAPFHGSQA